METTTTRHVPQHGPHQNINAYHAECPRCEASNGQYCRGAGTEIDGVGPVPHRERVQAAQAAGPCAECAG